MHFKIFIWIVFDKCLQAFQNQDPQATIIINFGIGYLFVYNV